MTPRVPDEQLNVARILRSRMTVAEQTLWHAFRGRGVGAKLRRQVPIGPYVADFACLAARLVVGVDDRTHDDEARRAHDAERDAWFSSHGWRSFVYPTPSSSGVLTSPSPASRKSARISSSDPR